MNGKLVKTLLVASLVLNVALITYIAVRGSGVALHHETRTVRETPRPDPPGLDLNEEQQTRIRSILKEFRLTLISSKQNMLNKRMEIIEELSSPEPDRELIWDNVAELNQLEADLNREFVTALIDVSNHLGSGQNIEFLLRLSRHWLYFGKKISGDCP